MPTIAFAEMLPAVTELKRRMAQGEISPKP